MGTLIFWGVVVLGLCMGLVIVSLLSLAQKGEKIYDIMPHGEEITSPENPVYRTAAETKPLIRSGEARPQRDLGASVATQ